MECAEEDGYSHSWIHMDLFVSLENGHGSTLYYSSSFYLFMTSRDDSNKIFEYFLCVCVCLLVHIHHYIYIFISNLKYPYSFCYHRRAIVPALMPLRAPNH